MSRIPSISFVENNVGVTPIRQNIRNRIGMVAPFTRGPVTPNFITGDTFFSNTYGSDTSIGSLAYQAARDQGAEDFVLARVLGNAQPSSGHVTFTGTATINNTLNFKITFFGDAVTSNIDEVITTSGIYKGAVSGRYFFKVTELAAGVATVKYVYKTLDITEVLDAEWTSITDSITVTLADDQGVAKEVGTDTFVTFGITGQSSDISLQLNDTFTIRTNVYTIAVPISVGDIPYQIANTFQSSVSGREVINEVILNSTDNGVVFKLDPTQTDILGKIGDKFAYTFTLNSVDAGLTLDLASGVYRQFTGGVDGPRQAFRDFYSINGTPLLRLVCNYVGDYGNKITATIIPNGSNKFRLILSDLNASNFNPRLQTETYNLDFNDLDSNGFLNQVRDSIFVNAIFLPKFTDPVGYNVNLVNQVPVRLAAPDINITDVEDPRHPDYFGPSKLIDVTLENGFDGPVATDEDYVRAINSLKDFPIHIVLAPGTTSVTVQQALISHAENSNDKDGLRIAVLNTRPKLSPNAASQETFGFNSQRGVKVVGWSTYAGQPNSPRFGLSPDALYAGKLASIPFYVSPHARRTSGPLINIVEVDTAQNSNNSALQLFTDARLEVLQVNPSTQSFVFTNGVTISSDVAWEPVYIRRTYDIVRQDLYEIVENYIGEPHTNLLRVQIETAISSYLRELQRLGQIANFKNVIVSSANNPPELYVTRKLNVSLEFLPIYAVDYIEISIIRNTQEGLSTIGV